MQRREYIAGFVATVISAISGCLSSRSADAQLGKITLINQDNQPHTIQVIIKSDNNLVYKSNYRLRRSSQIGTSKHPVPVIKNEWPAKSGQFTVIARINNQRKEQITLTKSGCHALILQIGEQGRISFFTGIYERGCNEKSGY